jgi:GNAT superfamily N-acetyltransferase
MERSQRRRDVNAKAVVWYEVLRPRLVKGQIAQRYVPIARLRNAGTGFPVIGFAIMELREVSSAALPRRRVGAFIDDGIFVDARFRECGVYETLLAMCVKEARRRGAIFVCVR